MQEALVSLEILAAADRGTHGKLALMSSIHERIKARRLATGLSQQELAAAVSQLEGLKKPLTYQTVQQWENGTSAPKRTRLKHVATALKTSVGDLTGEAESTNAVGEARPAYLPNRTPGVEQSLEAIGRAVRSMPKEDREILAGLVGSWIRDGGDDHYVELIAMKLHGSSSKAAVG